MEQDKLREAASVAIGCIEDKLNLRELLDQGFKDAMDQKIQELSAAVQFEYRQEPDVLQNHVLIQKEIVLKLYLNNIMIFIGTASPDSMKIQQTDS